MTEPLLKWPGGKRKLCVLLESLFEGPCRAVYHEPFLGSGALFLARAASGQVQTARLSDVNPRLVSFHRAVRDRPDGVLEALDQLPKATTNEDYLAVREAFNAAPPAAVDARQAARLLWLNKACFNGLYRENRAGAFNVSWGKRPVTPLPSEAHLRAVSALLQRAEICPWDFRSAMALAGAGDQVYADPPYVPNSDTGFTKYAAEEFGAQAHRDLAALSVAAARRGAQVLVSQHDMPATTELYEGLTVVHRMDVQRHISCKAARAKAVEVILSPRGASSQGGE